MSKSKFIFVGIVLCLSLPTSTAKLATKESTVSLPGKAKVIDLTQLVNSKAPTWDGKQQAFNYHVLTSVAKDGYATGEFCTHEHFGTHMDAPVHFVKGGKSISQLSPTNLVLPITVIDVRTEAKKNPDYVLNIDKIKEIESKTKITNNSAILLLTGWDKYYFGNEKYRNADRKGVMHFPGFSADAAKYLIDQHHAKAFGIDTLSIDCGSTEDFPVHKLVLGKGLFMIEDLCNLDQLPTTGAVGIFAPLKLEGGTGCPARVLALIPK